MSSDYEAELMGAEREIALLEERVADLAQELAASILERTKLEAEVDRHVELLNKWDEWAASLPFDVDLS